MSDFAPRRLRSGVARERPAGRSRRRPFESEKTFRGHVLVCGGTDPNRRRLSFQQHPIHHHREASFSRALQTQRPKRAGSSHDLDLMSGNDPIALQAAPLVREGSPAAIAVEPPQEGEPIGRRQIDRVLRLHATRMPAPSSTAYRRNPATRSNPNAYAETPLHLREQG